MQIRKLILLFFILLAGCSSLPAGGSNDSSPQAQSAPLNQPGQSALVGTPAKSAKPAQQLAIPRAATQTSAQPTAQAGAQPTAQTGAQPTAVPQPSAPKAPPAGAPLSMTIDSPLDKAVVSSANLTITGKVSRQAVLTINDTTYLVPAGPFSEPYTLAQGPNTIQIVASDTSGNEVDLILTVTYQP